MKNYNRGLSKYNKTENAQDYSQLYEQEKISKMGERHKRYFNVLKTEGENKGEKCQTDIDNLKGITTDLSKLQAMMNKIEKKAYNSAHEKELSLGKDMFPRLEEEFVSLQNVCENLKKEKKNAAEDSPALRDQQQHVEQWIKEFKDKILKHVNNIKQIKKYRDSCDTNIRDYDEEINKLKKDFQEAGTSIEDLNKNLRDLNYQKELLWGQKDLDLDKNIDDTKKYLRLERKNYEIIGLHRSREEARREDISHQRTCIELYEKMYVAQIVPNPLDDSVPVQGQQSPSSDVSHVLETYASEADNLLESIRNPKSIEENKISQMERREESITGLHQEVSSSLPKIAPEQHINVSQQIVDASFASTASKAIELRDQERQFTYIMQEIMDANNYREQIEKAELNAEIIKNDFMNEYFEYRDLSRAKSNVGVGHRITEAFCVFAYFSRGKSKNPTRIEERDISGTRTLNALATIIEFADTHPNNQHIQYFINNSIRPIIEKRMAINEFKEVFYVDV